MGQIDIKDISIEPYELGGAISKFDMTLSAVEAGQTISFTLEYCTGLFKKETIMTIARDYKDILDQVALNTEIAIGEIKLEYEYNTIINKQQEYTDFDF
jgi:hypothetical protein